MTRRRSLSPRQKSPWGVGTPPLQQGGRHLLTAGAAGPAVGTHLSYPDGSDLCALAPEPKAAFLLSARSPPAENRLAFLRKLSLNAQLPRISSQKSAHLMSEHTSDRAFAEPHLDTNPPPSQHEGTALRYQTH